MDNSDCKCNTASLSFIGPVFFLVFLILLYFGIVYVHFGHGLTFDYTGKHPDYTSIKSVFN